MVGGGGSRGRGGGSFVGVGSVGGWKAHMFICLLFLVVVVVVVVLLE